MFLYPTLAEMLICLSLVVLLLARKYLLKPFVFILVVIVHIFLVPVFAWRSFKEMQDKKLNPFLNN